MSATQEGRKIHFRALVGSHNYNMAHEDSDRDYKEFVLPTFRDLYFYKFYHHSILGENGGDDYDIHDIRKLPEFLYKANFNYLEIFASSDVQVLIDSPELQEMFSLKKEIYKMNLRSLFNSCYGAYMNKYKSIEKSTQGTHHLLKMYGYDTKQAFHAYRVMRFLEKFHASNFEDFEGSIKFEGEELEFANKIRHGGMSIDEYREFIEDYVAEKIKPIEDDFYNYPVNPALKYHLTELVLKMVHREVQNG